MIKRILGAAAGAALLAGLAAAPANATDTQFAAISDFSVSYNHTTGILTTGNTPESVVLTFPTGDTAATDLFPNGMDVTISLSATKVGPVNITRLNGVSYSYFDRPLDDGDLTITYTGAPVTVNNHTVVTTGEVLAQLTNVDFDLTGFTGSGAPLGVTLSFDDQSPPTTGDYSGGGFFVFQPNGDIVTESDFSFVDSSARFSVSTYVPNFTADFSGNLSSDPSPVITGVPEPASWALMLIGIGIVGGSLRRRASLAV